MKTYQAIVTRKREDSYTNQIENRQLSDLKDNGTLVRVLYSSVNYKDFLSMNGNRGVTSNFPHTPGVDAFGIVESSDNVNLIGKTVVITGNDLGMNTDGGFGQYINVPSEWVTPLPQETSGFDIMAYGTAGLTAALSVDKIIQNNIKGKILVTGATGGVGLSACAILSHLGYEVVASTSKLDQKQHLIDLGVSEVISREEVILEHSKPLAGTKWDAVIDTVGGETLANVIRQVKHYGVVTTCGNIAGDKFSSSVYPFILRGITLYGIDAVNVNENIKQDMWRRMLTDYFNPKYKNFITEISLEEVLTLAQTFGQSQHVGRFVVKID